MINRLPESLQDQIRQEYPDRTDLHEFVKVGGPLLSILDILVEENSRLATPDRRKLYVPMAAGMLRRNALFAAVATALEYDDPIQSN